MEAIKAWIKATKPLLTEEVVARMLMPRPLPGDFDEEAWEAAKVRLFNLTASSVPQVDYGIWDVGLSESYELSMDALLSHFLDSDTFFVTSPREQEIAKRLWEEHPHKIMVDQVSDVNVAFIKQRAEEEGCSKILICYTGTTNTGQKVEDSSLIKLNGLRTSFDVTFVLDASYEMFWNCRDYSLYDYVVGTGNNNGANFNMGIVLGKQPDYMPGIKSQDWLNAYVDSTTEFLNLRSSVNALNGILHDYFVNECNPSKIRVISSDYWINSFLFEPALVVENPDMDAKYYVLRTGEPFIFKVEKCLPYVDSLVQTIYTINDVLNTNGVLR